MSFGTAWWLSLRVEQGYHLNSLACKDNKIRWRERAWALASFLIMWRTAAPIRVPYFGVMPPMRARTAAFNGSPNAFTG